jgi:hypothetical protein
MSDFKVTLDGFLSCFRNFEFNIIKKNKKVQVDMNADSIQQSESHLLKMLQQAKRELSRAYKAHKAGKMSIDELFDYEWHVSDLEQQIKGLKDHSEDECDTN